MSEQPSIEARVGARWWADKLRTGFFPDNGAAPDDTTKSPEALGLIAMARKRAESDLTPEKIDAFERALAEALDRQIADDLKRFGGRAPAIDLSVDYDPDSTLEAALRGADIPARATVLPWKTVMWLEPGRVEVAEGYGASPVALPLGCELETRGSLDDL